MIEAVSNLLGGMPREAVIALLALVSLQLLSQVVALVHLAGRPAAHGERKWVWALVILFGSLLGAVVYFALGRRPADHSADTERESEAVSRTDALDRLYAATSRAAG